MIERIIALIILPAQGDNMKNKLLLMMLTILGMPAVAYSYSNDLAAAEYNFAVNELSKSSYNQAAIIGQDGSHNRADTRQDGHKLQTVVVQNGTGNRANVDQSGNYNLTYVSQDGFRNDADIQQNGFGNSAIVIQKGSNNRANVTQYGTQKTAVVVQKNSFMNIRVTQR